VEKKEGGQTQSKSIRRKKVSFCQENTASASIRSGIVEAPELRGEEPDEDREEKKNFGGDKNERGEEVAECGLSRSSMTLGQNSPGERERGISTRDGRKNRGNDPHYPSERKKKSPQKSGRHLRGISRGIMEKQIMGGKGGRGARSAEGGTEKRLNGNVTG